MARRASSGISPGLLIGIAILVIAAFFGGKMLLGKKAESFADTATLSMNDLLENGNSLRGNEYVVEGVVDGKLRWTPDEGQVISLKVGTGNDSEFLGVKIPPNLSKVNIEREKRYAIKIQFARGGIAVATGINPL